MIVDNDQQDCHWMRHALGLAERAAERDEVPVGAVVVLDGEVIGEGFNHPISGCDPTLHAEVAALRDAAKRVGNYRLSGATLYVTIEPCSMCAGALVHARIARLVYGAVEPKAGSVVSNNSLLDGDHLNHQVAYSGGVLAEECSAMMRDFFRRRRAEHKRLKKSRTESL